MTADPQKKLPPMRVYEVQVGRFAPVLYCARSPSQARGRAYWSYADAFNVTFKEFLQERPRIRVVPPPPGVGEHILVNGKPARRALGQGNGHYVHFMFDDGDQVLVSHPNDVKPYVEPEYTHDR